MNCNKKLYFFSLLFLFIYVFSTIVFAENLTADEIIDLVKDRQVEYLNSKTHAEMIIIDKNGKSEEREIIMYQKEEDDKISILMRFLSPKNVEGVTLLSSDNGDKIYLYMPAYQNLEELPELLKKKTLWEPIFPMKI